MRCIVKKNLRSSGRRERAEHLFCLGVVEAIKTAFERLAIKRDNSRAGPRRVKVQVGRVFAKDFFNVRRRQPLQNIPDSRMCGRPFPAYLESFVQLSSMNFDEGADAAIRVGAAYDR